MDVKKQLKIMDEATYSVVKSNELIRNSRYNLSLVEQKIILRLIQIIKPEDEEFETYNFEIKEFCEICGISDRSGQTYNYIREIIKELRSKNLVIKNGDVELICGWIESSKYDNSTGIIQISLSKDLKPYLLELKKNFTEYSLNNILSMKSKYSIRMYELLKSFEYLGTISLDIDTLKANLYATQYSRWSDVKNKVIDVSVMEINRFTDIKVSYTVKKSGKKIQYVNFDVEKKNSEETVRSVYNSRVYQRAMGTGSGGSVDE